MSNDITPIPILMAKGIAVRCRKHQVIVIGFERGVGTHVTTYGVTTEDCDQVAQAGNWLKEFLLKWPKGECQAEPNRVKKLRAQIRSLESGLASCNSHRESLELQLKHAKEAVANG